MKKNLYLALWAILLLEYAYIFLILLSYDMAWMNPEKFWTHAWILENGSQLHWQDIPRSLNIDVIEVNPDRLSRPLSNLFEVIDTKFRASLWNLIPPHPAISLLWPILFLALPVFFYLFLVNMGCGFPVAFSGTALYMTSVGFLGPIIMLFHPAKSLVNFTTIVCLWASSVLYKKSKESPKNFSIKDIPAFWKYYLISLIVLFVGFFCDETGLFAYAINLMILFPILMRVKEKTKVWGALLSLPILYFLMLKVILPAIHLWVRGHAVNVSHYESYPHLSALLLPNVSNLLTNLSWLFADYPHLTFNLKNLCANGSVLILQFIYSGLLIFLLGLFFIKNRAVSKLNALTLRAALFLGLLIAYGFFQTFQLSVNAFVWGVWWYGSLFSLMYFVAFSFVLQRLWEDYGERFQKYFVVLIFILVLDGLIFTTYRIAIFKHQNMNRNNYPYREIFNGNINPYTNFSFSESFEKSKCKYIYTKLEWAKAKEKNIGPLNPSQISQCQSLMANNVYFPIEMIYVPIELKPKK